jgi:hypothetical protein
LARHRIRTAVCHPSIRYGNINAASRTHRFSDAPSLHAGYSFRQTAVTHQYDKTISATPFLRCTASSRSLYILLCATHEYDTTTTPPLLETAISVTPIPAPHRRFSKRPYQQRCFSDAPRLDAGNTFLHPSIGYVRRYQHRRRSAVRARA